MAKFGFNPKDASAGFPLLPADEFEIKLGEPKAFFGEGKDGKDDNYGVRFIGSVNEGEHKGKKYSIQCFQHNQASKDFAKQIQMAALGFTKNQEKDFDEKYGNEESWTGDSDDGSCGQGWHDMAGQVIIVKNLQKPNPNTGDLQNSLGGVRPFSL